jgi:hypothetical protein
MKKIKGIKRQKRQMPFIQEIKMNLLQIIQKINKRKILIQVIISGKMMIMRMMIFNQIILQVNLIKIKIKDHNLQIMGTAQVQK